MSFLKKPWGNPSGAYGTFTSNYSDEQKKQIKDKIGLSNPDLGVKIFYGRRGWVSVSNISEVLAFYYIGPYIAEHTGFKIPTPPVKLSFSALCASKAIMTQAIKGKTLNDTEIGSYVNGADVHYALLEIGVAWYDYNDNNIMLEQKVIDHIESMDAKAGLSWEEKNELAMENLWIIDFGAMKCDEGTQPGQQLMKLKRKLESLQNNLPQYNSIIQDIIAAIDNTIL